MPSDTQPNLVQPDLPQTVAVGTPSLRMQGITVTFGTVTALESVSLDLVPGLRHAVVGENGAGKSTLMKVLFGLVRPDSGLLRIGTKTFDFKDPASPLWNVTEAIAHGIGMVHQHFELIPSFTVAENVVLGAEGVDRTQKSPLGFFNRKSAEARVAALAEESGFSIDPSARVDSLSVAAQQRVEILKALYHLPNARNRENSAEKLLRGVLILDEPTAVLSPSEAHELWKATARLSATGMTVVFITHKLDDVMAQAEQVTVLRRGRRILSRPVSETNPPMLAAAMVGGDVAENAVAKETQPHRKVSAPGNIVLSIQKLSVRGSRGEKALENVSLEVQAGEIVALVGVDGSGQTELIESVIGLRKVESGQICLHGQDISALPVAKRRQSGIGYIPEDRQHRALVLPFTCSENSVLGRERDAEFDRWGTIRLMARDHFLQDRSTAFDVRGATPHTLVSSLSGGNQQKLVLARELSRRPDVLLASQPTRGLDFAASAFVYDALRAERDRGAAVLLQSLDLDESLLLADRVAVLLAGRIVAIVPLWSHEIIKEGIPAHLNRIREKIGALMTGAAYV